MFNIINFIINRWLNKSSSTPIFIVQINNDDWCVVRTFHRCRLLLSFIIRLECNLNIKKHIDQNLPRKKKILMTKYSDRKKNIQNFTIINFILCLLKHLSHSIYLWLKNNYSVQRWELNIGQKKMMVQLVYWYGFYWTIYHCERKKGIDSLRDTLSTVRCDCNNIKRSITHIYCEFNRIAIAYCDAYTYNDPLVAYCSFIVDDVLVVVALC